MTTSGQIQTKKTISELIQEAFDYCQIGVEEESTTAEDYQRALRSANFLLRTWQAQGIHLWQYTEGTLFLLKDRVNYKIPDPAVRAVRSDLVASTNPTQDYPAGTGTFNLTFDPFYDDDGVFWGFPGPDSLLGWFMGFCIGDTIEWRTSTNWVLELDGSFSATVAFPINSDVSENTRIFLYPSSLSEPKGEINAERFLSVRRANFLASTFENETPINFVSHDEYVRLPNKSTPGVPNECTYDRQINNGVFRLWQSPDNECEYQIKFTFERTFEKFDAPSDTADFPRYWEDAFIFNLAKRLAIKFRIPSEIKMDISNEAERTLNAALSYDNANYDLKVNVSQRATL